MRQNCSISCLAAPGGAKKKSAHLDPPRDNYDVQSMFPTLKCRKSRSVLCTGSLKRQCLIKPSVEINRPRHVEINRPWHVEINTGCQSMRGAAFGRPPTWWWRPSAGFQPPGQPSRQDETTPGAVLSISSSWVYYDI